MQVLCNSARRCTCCHSFSCVSGVHGGSASCEKLQILQGLKLAKGDIEPEAADDWVCMEWGEVGGPAAREAALWVQLQREFKRRNLLPLVAVRRLDALDFQWEPKVPLLWTCLPSKASHLLAKMTELSRPSEWQRVSCAGNLFLCYIYSVAVWARDDIGHLAYCDIF